jgi:hypothetical protein
LGRYQGGGSIPINMALWLSCELIFFFFFPLMVLGFELRASLLIALYHLSHSCCPFFVLIIFEIGSCFMPRPVWTIIFLFVFPYIAGMTGICHHAQSLAEIRSCEQFYLDWPQTIILLISVSCAAGTSGLSHCTLPEKILFLTLSG